MIDDAGPLTAAAALPCVQSAAACRGFTYLDRRIFRSRHLTNQGRVNKVNEPRESSRIGGSGNNIGRLLIIMGRWNDG